MGGKELLKCCAYDIWLIFVRTSKTLSLDKYVYWCIVCGGSLCVNVLMLWWKSAIWLMTQKGGAHHHKWNSEWNSSTMTKYTKPQQLSMGKNRFALGDELKLMSSFVHTTEIVMYENLLQQNDGSTFLNTMPL